MEPDAVIVLPPNSNEGPPLSIVNGSVGKNTNDADTAGDPPQPCGAVQPRLQIAMTGSTTGPENLRVLVPVPDPPVNAMMSLMSGGLPTVPPENVLSGPQLGKVPLRTVKEVNTSPPYDSSTELGPGKVIVPAAVPVVALVQSVQKIGAAEADDPIMTTATKPTAAAIAQGVQEHFGFIAIGPPPECESARVDPVGRLYS
jgi:hypothetical protein